MKRRAILLLSFLLLCLGDSTLILADDEKVFIAVASKA